MSISQSEFDNKNPFGNDWLFKSKESKSVILEKIGNIVASGYLDQKTHDVQYEPLSTTVQNFAQYAGRYTDNNEVILSHTSVLNQSKAIQLIAHEATHHAQALFIDQDKDQVNSQYIQRYDALQANALDHDSTVFGIDTNGPAYLKGGGSKLNVYKNLQEAFYTLCPLEREAREAEIEIARQFGFNDKTQRDIDNATQLLKEKYMCQDFTDEQVFAMLDQAIINIATGSRPSNAREASITYDYAALLYGQSGTKEYLETLTLMSPEQKYCTLADAGFDQSDPIMQRLANHCHMHEYVPQVDDCDKLFNNKSNEIDLSKLDNVKTPDNPTNEPVVDLNLLLKDQVNARTYETDRRKATEEPDMQFELRAR